ncbi:hypothetical protein SBA3_1250026 [Candidatus Sulfopaludibacter sp. SbA3]|nr:hypothetical protein SBA3_1250026 [Candidatus Sulfopaludibacter sp. SbA3]
MSDLPPEWVPHFELIQGVIAGSVRMPFDKREPVQRLEADIGVDFNREPGVRAVIAAQPPGHLMRLPIGLYLRTRLIALVFAKNRSGRLMPEYFSGNTILDEQAQAIVSGMRSAHLSLEALQQEVEQALAAIGNDEPEPRVSSFGSQAELVTYYALNFVAIHEACHFWYGHFGLIHASAEPFRGQAWSLKEVQADMGAGTSLADHLAADLEIKAIPAGSHRSLARIHQLAQLAGLAMAVALDLLDTLHNPGRLGGYESYGVRLWIARLGFRKHLVSKCGVDAGEWGVLGLIQAEQAYNRLAGRQTDGEALIARMKEIFSAEEFVWFHERQRQYIPNTPDKEALARLARAQSESGSRSDPEAIERVDSLAGRGRRRGLGLYLTDLGPAYEIPRGAERPDPQAAPGDDFWRAWLDPLEIIRPGLANAIVDELRNAAAIAASEIGKIVILWPDIWSDAQSGVTPEDPAFGSFRISIGTGLTSRLPLILRCLFDRLGDSPAREDLTGPPDAALDEHYAALVAASDSADALRWWAAVAGPPADGESYEFRNAWRYGLLFLLFRAACRIHRAHFTGLERAELELDQENLALLRLGLHLDADLFALLNLVVYISHFADLETGAARMHDGLLRVITRGQHLRAAFFGVFAVISCLPAAARVAFVVKGMDHMGIPTDGEPMFACFQWIHTLPPFAKATRKWNWSDFVVACFHDWDERTTAFRAGMRDSRALSPQPNPFVSASALRFDESTFERYKAANTLAHGYIDDPKRVLISRQSFTQVYGTG